MDHGESQICKNDVSTSESDQRRVDAVSNNILAAFLNVACISSSFVGV